MIAHVVESRGPGDDDLLPLEAVTELRGMARTSKLLNIPFAGHAAFDDQKDMFLISLRQFPE